MKLIWTLFFIISCASNQETKPDPRSVDPGYLKELNTLISNIGKTSKNCKSYTSSNIKKAIIETPGGKEEYGFKFQGNSSSWLRNYNPEQFDWRLKARIKNLYLDYPFNENLSKVHFERSPTVKYCHNEFSNLNFLKATINILKNKKTNKSQKKLALNALEKYFRYISKNEIPVISVLTTSYLVEELYRLKLVKIEDEKEFFNMAKEFEDYFTLSGQNILASLSSGDYEEIYKIDSAMRTKKRNFKTALINSFKI